MERVYEYNKTSYKYKVQMTNILMVPLLGYFVYRVITSETNVVLWVLGAVICIYSLANSFIRKSNPRVIRISDDEIVFSSFGEKCFEINKLIKFNVKVSTPNYQVVVRVEDVNRQHGAFWVTYSQFNDNMDLLAEFDYLEKKINPDSLRLRGKIGMGDRRPDNAAPKTADEKE